MVVSIMLFKLLMTRQALKHTRTQTHTQQQDNKNGDAFCKTTYIARTFDIFEGNDTRYHLVVPVRGQNTKEMTNCLGDEYTYMTNTTKKSSFRCWRQTTADF